MSGIEDEPMAYHELPSFLSKDPHIVDQCRTATSELQARTINECLPLLTAINSAASNPFDFDSRGLPFLLRNDHVGFLRHGLGPLPSGFVAMDASRPWLMYWSLMSFHLLGVDTKQFRTSLLKTFQPLQNKSGGFGGGQGHSSHLACTYAIVLTIAISEDEALYDLADRTALYNWLGRLKHASGGFQICEGGEVDTRGAYCALVAITLFGLSWELPQDSPARSCGFTDFRDGLGVYLSRCQNYEGGISAGPSNEAHGAYAFCSLACLSLLGHPQETINKYLDVPALIRWLSSRQYGPEGGFAGRTNKVVDGCYSHWIGGCWPLVEAAVKGPDDTPSSSQRLFDMEGLCRYILSCCQAPSGGLRDKPSKRPDAYHTCYNLVGLSMANHVQSYSVDKTGNLSWSVADDKNFSPEWEDEGDQNQDPRMPAYDPVYIIPHGAVNKIRAWSIARPFEFAAAQ